MGKPVLGVLTFLAIATVASGAVWYRTTGNKIISTSPAPAPVVEAAQTSSINLLEGGNTINVLDQEGGDLIFIDLVVLDKPAFVVIHKALAGGSAGEVLGVSELLTSGEKSNVEVELDEEVGKGDLFMAQLHIDNGDGEYSADDPISTDEDGKPVSKTFKITKDVEDSSDSEE